MQFNVNISSHCFFFKISFQLIGHFKHLANQIQKNKLVYDSELAQSTKVSYFIPEQI